MSMRIILGDHGRPCIYMGATPKEWLLGSFRMMIWGKGGTFPYIIILKVRLLLTCETVFL